MCNILKNKEKFLLILSSFLISFALISDEINAQRSLKRVGGTRAKKSGRGQSAKANSVSGRGKNSTSSATKNSDIKKTDISNNEEVKDTSHITKYNCETLYNKCMNQKCYTPTNGRCSCNVEEKFNSVDAECKYIYNACPNLAKDIVDTYKRSAKSDCSNFTISNIKNTNVSLSNILYELTTCMKPKCKSKSNEFVGCFDTDNFEKKFDACKKVYENKSSEDIALLKEMFKDSISSYKEKYCNEIYGTIKNDGECYLQIGFGASFKTIQKVKEFKVGDNVICSENEFGTELGESKQQKLRHIKEIVLTGVDIAQKGTAFAGRIVGSMTEKIDEKSKQTIEKVETKTTVDANGNTSTTTKGTGTYMNVYKGSGQLTSSMSGIESINAVTEGMNVLVGSEHLAGGIGAVFALKEGNFKYKGYCFVIKGDIKKELFGASDDYYYKLRWGENWNEAMFSTAPVEGDK